MKRIFVFLIACLLLLFPLTSCSSPRYDYDLSEYIDLGNYQQIFASFADPEQITQEDIDRELFQVMLSFASFQERGAEETVAQYDKVIVEYDVSYQGEVLDDYRQDDYELVVGSLDVGEADYQMGQALIGCKKGEIRSINYTYPENDPSFWAGMTITFQVTVGAIYQSTIPECNDKFVQSLEGYSFRTVDDFRVHLKEEIRLSREEAKREAVYYAFFDGVTVKKYPEKEYEEYVYEFQKDSIELAERLDMSYEAYVAEYLQTDLKTFVSLAEEDAKEKVKTEMACVQLSRVLGVTLSKEEYQEGLKALYEAEGGESSSEFESLDDFEDYYTKNEIRQKLLWEKSFEVLVQNAKRIENL